MPVYNGSRYIRQAVESVFSQTVRDWELIIVDDGSTDCSVKIAAELSDRRITVISQDHQGVSVARNTGIAQSRADYVFFLDCDDVVFPNTLHRLGRELDGHPNAVLAFGPYTRFVSGCPIETGAREPIRLRRKPCGDALASLLTRCPLLMGSVLVRRRPIALVGGFDSGLPVNEDWVFWCDLAAVGPFRNVGGKPLFAYRWHRESRTRKLGLDAKAGWPAIELIFEREAIQQRFSEVERVRLRRRAEAWTLRVASLELLRMRDWRQMPGVVWGMLARDPVSFCLDGIAFGLEGAISAAQRCKGLLAIR